MEQVIVTKHPYMTGPERAQFKRMVASGTISFFRISKCHRAECDQQVPKDAKKFCSEQCFRKETENDVRKPIEEEEPW